ncbi:MAG: hypothetical protein HQM16_10800 [Deltaproteobacteria bacterium]|nr:hypothetical protein [Deltaproteobacteria bacterium]
MATRIAKSKNRLLSTQGKAKQTGKAPVGKVGSADKTGKGKRISEMDADRLRPGLLNTDGDTADDCG